MSSRSCNSANSCRYPLSEWPEPNRDCRARREVGAEGITFVAIGKSCEAIEVDDEIAHRRFLLDNGIALFIDDVDTHGRFLHLREHLFGLRLSGPCYLGCMEEFE